MLLIVMASALIFSWSSMNAYQKDRVYSLVGLSDTAQAKTASGRMDGMVSEFKVGFKRPIFGHGVGTASEAKFNNGAGTQVSHNMYAEILIELGLVGFIFFGLFIGRLYSFINELKSSDVFSSPFHQNVITMFKVLFFVVAFYSLTYRGLSQYYWYMFAGIVIAFGSSLSDQYTEKQQPPK